MNVPTWKRLALLIGFFLLLLAVFPGEELAGILAFFVLIIFYISLYALLGGRVRDGGPVRMPLGAVPIAYCLIQITPALEYLNAKMNLRRSKRIRAFLKLANDLRMRKKRVYGFLPRRPGG